MNTKIIVLQATPMSRQFFGNMMSVFRLDAAIFHICGTAAECSDCIVPNYAQTLITGEIDGNAIRTSQFIAEMRAKNPQLYVVSYSGSRHIEGCDLVLNKDDGAANFEAFRALVARHLSQTLHEAA